jgi:DNA-binding MarR family transcriptional regulator
MTLKKSPFDLTHQNQHVDSKIVAALERIAMAFRVMLWTESKEHAMSPIQIQLLVFLLHHSEEKRKVSYLAQEFNLTKATISDAVKALDAKGLIEKSFDQEDNRSYCMHLSTKGRQLAEQTAMFTGKLQQPIDRLPKGEKEALLVNLLHIIEHLTKSGVITVQRMCYTCNHYKSNHQGAAHYCQLLDKGLGQAELRIDCPEHQQKAG